MSLWRTLWTLLDVFPLGTRRFVVTYSIATGALTVLDAAALGLLVVTLAPLVTGSEITVPLLGSLPNATAPWLIVIVCGVLVTKSAAAVVLFRFGTRRLAHYEREVGDRIFREYTHSAWDKRSEVSAPELTRIVDTSVSASTFSFIAQLIQVPGYLLTCFAVLVVLFVAEPISAFAVVVYLGAFLIVMFRVVLRRSHLAGRTVRDSTYRTGTVMAEMLDALRELTLRSKLDDVAAEISTTREVASSARGRLVFLATVPRYALEMALIGGIVIVGGISFATSGGQAALISIGLFGAVALRLIPSIVMLQSSLGGARANQPFAEDVIRHLSVREAASSVATRVDNKSEFLSPQGMLRLVNVSYSYPGHAQSALSDINLELAMGSRVAIVGPSGSGKSTLIDLILGLRSPTEGAIFVDDAPLSEVLPEWRARVGYVPQRVALFDASIAQNVALTWGTDLDADKVIHAMRRAQLDDLVDRSQGLAGRLGERGSAISGGQQQRLGLARALYTDPLVLVLDEATSALDTSTESLVMASLRALGRDITIVAIAHRLATIKDFDVICYIEDGKLLGLGSFEEVQAQVSAFAAQVELAGLSSGDDTLV